MLNRDSLSREHAELAILTDAMLAQVNIERPDHAALGALRWRLSRVLLIHLAKEDKVLYPQLRRGSPTARALSERFADEMGGLAAEFTEYVEDWPIQRMAADWTGFKVRTRAILGALGRRIHREETELYPLIA